MADRMLDAVKIQARVLIPVVKALESELGKEKAHQLVGDAIAESWSQYMVSQSTGPSGDPRDSSGGLPFPVESEVVAETENSYGINMTGCAFADYFRQIGEPEIGALLTCNLDFAVERKLRPDWEFTRTQTRMQGAAHCDFRWRRKT